MDLKRPLVVLALAGALTGCGPNTDLERGTTECGPAEVGASEQDLCEDAETDNEEQSETEDDGSS
jgi:predicted small lipoprotein YifL